MNKYVKSFLPFLIFSSIFFLVGCSLFPGQATPVPTVLAPVVGDSRTIADGVVVPKTYVSLAFLTSGEVAEVSVEEGDQVSPGDILALLRNREALEAEQAGVALELLVAQQTLADLKLYATVDQKQAVQAVLDARLAVVAARQALDALDEDQYQADLGQARSDIKEARQALEDAQDVFDDYKDLDPQNTTRQQAEDDLQIAQKNYHAALAVEERLLVNREQLELNLSRAEAQLALAEAESAKRSDGPNVDQLLKLETQISALEKRLAALDAALKNLAVSAPIAGEVVSVKIKPGEVALAGQPIFIIADLSTWYIETSDLTELEVVKIHTGQRVEVVPESLPGEKITGVVESIGQVGTVRQGDVTYLAKIKLDATSLPLRWGMTVTVYFEP